MTTATLTFNLPEDHDAMMDAINGTEYASVIRDVLERLRRAVKDDMPGAEYADALRKEIYEMLSDRGCRDIF